VKHSKYAACRAIDAVTLLRAAREPHVIMLAEFALQAHPSSRHSNHNAGTTREK